MSRQFNPNYRHKKRSSRVITTRSSAVASAAQVNAWYRNITAEIRAILIDDPSSYVYMFETFRELTVNAYQLYSDTLINAGPWAAPAAVWPARPAKPADMMLAHYNDFMAFIDVHDALMVGAAAAPALFDPTDANNYYYSGPTPAEFDDLIMCILIAYAHSGFTGLGDLTQTVSFAFNDMPTDEDHSVVLSDLSAALPDGITIMKLGRAHANTIAHYLKDQDIMTDWGRRHNVPVSLNHLSFACWDYITDATLLNDQYRAAMRQVSVVALRDQNNTDFNDPEAPIASGVEQRERYATLATANMLATLEARNRAHESNIETINAIRDHQVSRNRRRRSGQDEQ